jgi:two-component system, response regulator PdtaR
MLGKGRRFLCGGDLFRGTGMAEGLRVMCVEDERLVAMALAGMLSRMGHTVCAVAASGEEALGLFGQARPDLVLMDIRLEGDLDGVETARLLREMSNTPVVYVTAYVDEPTRRRALAAGEGYLNKPADFDELRAALDAATGSGPGDL